MLRNFLYDHLKNSNTQLSGADESSTGYSNISATDNYVTVLSAFLAFDKDKNGLLDYEEFASLVTELEAMEMTSQELQVWFTKIDADNNGFIDFSELFTCWDKLLDNHSKHL